MRGYGEGSVYRHGNGWEAALIIHGRRRIARARTAREAREKLRELHRKARDNDEVHHERLTVAAYLEYWLDVTSSTVRPSTHKRYREYVRVHAVPEIGHLRLVDLKPMDLQRLYARRLAAGAAPSTVHHLHRTLHRALAMAERWEMVGRNVARLVSPPRVPRYKIEPLTLEEVHRFLDAAHGSRFEAAFVVAVSTGLRLGELLGLRWDDVALDGDPVLRVRGSLQRAGGKLQILEPKTAGSVRAVALPKLAADALRSHRLRQNAKRLLLGAAWHDLGLVFPNHWGRFMAPDYFTRREFRHLLDRAGLRDPTSLRSRPMACDS